MRLRILAIIAIDPLFELIRTFVAIYSGTSPRSHTCTRRHSGATLDLTHRGGVLVLHANTPRDPRLLAPVAEVRQRMSGEAYDCTCRYNSWSSEVQLERDIWQKMLPNFQT